MKRKGSDEVVNNASSGKKNKTACAHVGGLK